LAVNRPPALMNRFVLPEDGQLPTTCAIVNDCRRNPSSVRDIRYVFRRIDLVFGAMLRRDRLHKFTSKHFVNTDLHLNKSSRMIGGISSVNLLRYTAVFTGTQETHGSSYAGHYRISTWYKVSLNDTSLFNSPN